MNADEVVRNTVAGLRVMSESGDWSVDRQTCTDAAALIESLQSQLAESRRREKAAVADLTEIANDTGDACRYCKKCPCTIAEHSLSCAGFEWRGPIGGEGVEKE